MVNRLVVILAMLMLLGCSEPPTEYLPKQDIYDSEFDSAKVEEAISLSRNFAKDHGLTVILKNLEQSEFLTNGDPAFTMFLYSENDPIFFISNTGFGKIITINVSYYGKFKEGQIENLRDLLIAEFESELNLHFKKVDFEAATY